MVKEIVEPMFGQMLPGPLKGLKFVKLDLGPVPLVLSNVAVNKTAEDQGIKVDMDVDWEGKCDVELGGHMIPKLVSEPPGLRSRPSLSARRCLITCTITQGVKSVQLRGRLSILLCPITNVMPLVSLHPYSSI
jgi:hypothetical protein